MNKLLIAAAAISLLAPKLALAQDRSHDGGQQHPGWAADQGAGHSFHRGERMGYNDWSGAQPVDYRRHHLRRPPNGYEWRQSNGQFILAAVATGLVASVLLSR
jgi:Ni/Co efflux regulator RcnB